MGQMKAILISITILMSVLSISAKQPETGPTKEQQKADKKRLEEESKLAKQRAEQARKQEKEREKTEKKAAELERKRITVDFVQVTKFPSSYAGGGMRRVAYVGLGDIQPYRDSGITAYLLRLSRGYDSTAGVFLPEALTFVLDENTARQYVAAMEDLKRTDPYSINRTIPGDVYFEVIQADIQGQRYFAAKVSCIAIYGGFTTSLMASVGSCPILN
jgi:hypothetical protein